MSPQGSFLALVLALVTIQHVSISSPCLCLLIKNYKCPEPPTCCESGQYSLDECGCCMKCAKAELQTCGGASDISGKCGRGLQCLKTCLPCKTVGDRGLPCVFPFIYEDQYGNWTYNTCTTKDSDAGQPWCATAVDSLGYVVDNAWGDCLDGCPGTRVECDHKYFSIEEGKCIDVSVPGAIPNWKGAPAVKLEDPEPNLFDAPVCRNKGAAVRLYDNTCRCARGETALDYDLLGKPRGNCTGLEDDASDNLDKVWCFLENIRDPGQPQAGCYSDTQWSERDARYWSSLACTQSPDIESRNRQSTSFLPSQGTGGRNQPGRDRAGTSTQTPDPTTHKEDTKSSQGGLEEDYYYYTDVEAETSSSTTTVNPNRFIFVPEEMTEAAGYGGISFNQDGDSNLFDVLELLDL